MKKSLIAAGVAAVDPRRPRRGVRARHGQPARGRARLVHGPERPRAERARQQGHRQGRPAPARRLLLPVLQEGPGLEGHAHARAARRPRSISAGSPSTSSSPASSGRATRGRAASSGPTSSRSSRSRSAIPDGDCRRPARVPRVPDLPRRRARRVDGRPRRRRARPARHADGAGRGGLGDRVDRRASRSRHRSVEGGARTVVV